MKIRYVPLPTIVKESKLKKTQLFDYSNIKLVLLVPSILPQHPNLILPPPTDLSEVQKQLVGVNQRYEMVGVRLGDRKKELESTLGGVKAYLEDLQELLAWLEEKEAEAQGGEGEGMPVEAEAAKELLARHRDFHRQLGAKGDTMSQLKKKAHALMKDREHVPGLKDTKKQLKKLGE